MKFTLTYDTAIQFVKDWFGALAVMIAAVSYIGFSVSVPWAKAEDITAVQQQVIELRRDLNEMSCLTLQVLLRGYQEDRDNADDELRLNQASPSARRAKIEAESRIASIVAQMRDSKCK